MAEQQTQTTDTGPRPILPFLKLTPKPHLTGLKCGNCSAIYAEVKRLACSKCGASGQFQPVDLSDKGKLWVFSVVHQSFPGIKTPYVTAVIDLPEGVSVRSNLVDVDPDEMEKNPQKFFGIAVELTTAVVAKDREGHDVVAFQWRPSKN